MQEMGWQLQRGPTVKRTDRQTAECVKPEQDGRNSYMQLYRRQPTGEDGRVKWHHIAYTCLHMTEDLLKTVGLQYILSQVIAEYSNARRIVSILDKPIFTSTISIQPRAAESAKFTLGALESVVCPCHGAIEIVVVIIIIIIIIIRMLGDIDHPDSRATTTRATWWRWSPEHSLYFMYRVRHKKTTHDSMKTLVHAFIMSHVTTAMPFSLDRKDALLTSYKVYWMLQHVSSPLHESSTTACRSCCMTICTGLTSQNASITSCE